jgi:single-strand DNA-binding protein
VNQVILVGRLVDEPQISENNKEISNITIAIPRNYKNELGEYEIDFADCVLYNGIAKNTHEFCHKGDLICVKGRLETLLDKKSDISNKKTLIAVDKLTFLSSMKK